MRYPFGISCFFIRDKYNLQMFCLQSHQHCIFITGCRELRLISISDFLAILGGEGSGGYYACMLDNQRRVYSDTFCPTFPKTAKGTASWTRLCILLSTLLNIRKWVGLTSLDNLEGFASTPKMMPFEYENVTTVHTTTTSVWAGFPDT